MTYWNNSPPPPLLACLLSVQGGGTRSSPENQAEWLLVHHTGVLAESQLMCGTGTVPVRTPFCRIKNKLLFLFWSFLFVLLPLESRQLATQPRLCDVVQWRLCVKSLRRRRWDCGGFFFSKGNVMMVNNPHMCVYTRMHTHTHQHVRCSQFAEPISGLGSICHPFSSSGI